MNWSRTRIEIYIRVDKSVSKLDKNINKNKKVNGNTEIK